MGKARKGNHTANSLGVASLGVCQQSFAGFIVKVWIISCGYSLCFLHVAMDRRAAGRGLQGVVGSSEEQRCAPSGSGLHPPPAELTWQKTQNGRVASLGQL